MRAGFSVLIATRPPQLSKAFRLENGTLTSFAAAQMLEGVVHKRDICSIEGLAAFFAKMRGHNWAVAAGVTAYPRARVVTKNMLGEATFSVPTVARSRQHFHFPAGPGLLCLDYDAPGDGPPLAAHELHAAIVATCPWLDGVGALITASASSYIYERATGRQLKGPGGLHVYVLIDEARQIPRAVDAIFQSSFARYGHALITKSGVILPRTLVDRCSPQPERLLFECGAVLTEDLEQRRPVPHLIPGPCLASRSVPVCQGYEVWRASDAVWLEMKREAAPAAERVREAWIAERLATGRVSRATLERAVLGGILDDDFQVTLHLSPTVSIGTIRANLPRYVGMQIPDPLEPDYRSGSLCAVIFDWGIFSQAHGGYQLRFEQTGTLLNFDAYQPDPLDFNLAPTPDRLKFDD